MLATLVLCILLLIMTPSPNSFVVSGINSLLQTLDCSERRKRATSRDSSHPVVLPGSAYSRE